MFGHEWDDPTAMNTVDSAPQMPRSVVCNPFFDWGTDQPLSIPWADTIIYETHVKGATQLHPGIDEELRGTYAGIAHPAFIDHLVQLGVTTVELQPVHEFVHDSHLLERGLRNYWGYNSIGFFAPHHEYSHRHVAGQGMLGTQVQDFKQMVKTLHEAGIEVILDVVYNHTAEGNHLGPTLSMKGIDNAVVLPARRRRPAVLHGLHRHRQHAEHAQPVRAAARHGQPPLLGHRDARRRVPVRSRLGARPQPARGRPPLRVLRPRPTGSGGQPAEADRRAVGHRRGRVPGRQLPRRSGRSGTGGTATACASSGPAARPASASSRTGSRDRATCTSAPGALPHASINFITAHDGFTLRDLVSYHEKHNDANGEGNQDGESHNRSWNCGAEGPTDDPAVNELRARQQRNMLTTLLLSQGVPMILGGDEFGRTQHGNNNAYCQDNEISWYDWANVDEDLCRFATGVTAVRKTHPTFHRRHVLPGPRRARHPPGARLVPAGRGGRWATRTGLASTSRR